MFVLDKYQMICSFWDTKFEISVKQASRCSNFIPFQDLIALKGQGWTSCYVQFSIKLSFSRTRMCPFIFVFLKSNTEPGTQRCNIIDTVSESDEDVVAMPERFFIIWHQPEF